MRKQLSKMLGRAIRYLRLVWHRHANISVLTHLLMLVVGILCGVLLGTYRACLAEFIKNNGIGEFILRFAPVGGPTLGIIVFLWQVNRARYTQRIDLILKLAERFDKQEMKVTRAKAAKALLGDRDTKDDSVSQVLDFFEEVGFLVTRKAIDDEAVYTFFDYWAIQYYQATIKYRVELNRNMDPPDLYNKMDYLFKVLTDRAGKRPAYDHNKINAFLLEETRLVRKRPVIPS